MAKTIMIQGTMSNSGKSFVTAGLCRIFAQDGYRVAPFKSQNMALNSYITADGLEMGRAQVMQAEAAGIAPDVRMNPILLKPTSSMGSQVIVGGRVFGNMRAMDYYAKKKQFIPYILKAYESLARENDIIVIEGAGSPAEINLKQDDLVNMGLAKMVDAPVLLVGDIDRGGVFASLYGTVKLLEQSEQERIRGLIINKFRGDKTILLPGLAMIEELLKKPVIGCIPMEEIDIDDEDSLSIRLQRTRAGDGVDVAVILFPHISNFTDFNVLERIPGISLRYVQRAEEVNNPDFLILPGTKNTMEDLLWLRQKKMEEEIFRLHQRQVPIMGICGGFQMLGQWLYDPDQVESGGVMRGLGLLDSETIFESQKTRTQIKGKIIDTLPLFQGIEKVQGYEIHMGRTKNLGGCREWIQLEDGRCDGLSNREKTVFGSYLHGIFDTPKLAKLLAVNLNPQAKTMDFEEENYKEEQYNRLADLLRNSLDMKKIYQILG